MDNMTRNRNRMTSRNPYFEQLLKEGTNTAPIASHTQGLSRLAFALLAGLERRDQEPAARAPASAGTPSVNDGPAPQGPDHIRRPRNRNGDA